jgi:hypothetical protein
MYLLGFILLSISSVRRVELYSMFRQSGNAIFVFSVTCSVVVVGRTLRMCPRPVFIRLQLPCVTPLAIQTDCMYAHLRSGFCKSGLPISRLARLSAPTITTASSSSNPYPYPPHSNPTAHQIFHLPLTASQKEVKSRCLHRYAIKTPLK